jgi:hypothetical protein
MVDEAKSLDFERTRDQVFSSFVQQFSIMNNNRNIFPKKCRTCGKVYESLYQYLCDTEAKAQSLEDAGEIMGKSSTMIYRNCSCGNTLVVTVTDQILPSITDFWRELRRMAEIQGKPLKEVVTLFVEDWERQIHKQYNCLDRPQRF